ncbi:carbohydrate ABC transporter permease [Streptomyces sp. H27-C3]|uniref:carbohydrate ABC transporter permease n=1 Tax=Streptomyces sp. H27-C3 TaxID=3046305 RepID=UPI0024BBC80A|nr:carbohydrate ABC transporter permease [Streptomyces sp. H27-C3]MDJ0465286.1 carbohydrate ABC transporter permease [Streptomyces sp. H27-C3]
MPKSPTAPPMSFVWTRRIVLGLIATFALLPVYVMLSSSLKPLEDVSGKFRWIPSGFTIRPYFDIWETVPLARYFLNSLIVASSATVCSVIIAIFAAYAVSRYRFRGKRLFTVTVLSTQMFPGILFLPPLFLIYVNIGNATGVALYGSRGGLILAYLTFSLPFSIWMLIGYFDSIPRELDEAAMVDGCGPLGALFRVVVAASLVVSIPVVIGFLLLQRYLVAGLTAGAVK